MKYTTFQVGWDDPDTRCAVCGKEVRPGQETARVQRDETWITLCCPLCLSAFEESPELYRQLQSRRQKDYATLRRIPFRSKEVSWLSFNQRVLQEAENAHVPLVERMRYLGIFSSNLDEFFRVRVATLKRLSTLTDEQISELQVPDPRETLKVVLRFLGRESGRFDRAYEAILCDLRKLHNIHVIRESEVPSKLHEYVNRYFEDVVRPHLMPIMLKGRRRLRRLRDQPLYLAVRLSKTSGKGRPAHALIELPTRNFPRFLALPESGGCRRVMFLDDVIRFGLRGLFTPLPYDRIESYAIKFTRDAELEFDDDVTEGVFAKIEEGLKAREMGSPVRLSYDASIPRSFLRLIQSKLNICTEDTFSGARYHNRRDLVAFPDFGDPALRFLPFRPAAHPAFSAGKSLFKTIRSRDILLHFPYQPFSQFIDLLREAAIDPLVDRIQLTQYRIAKDSAVAKALFCAVQNGKEVTVVVEPRARFDEEANITWANEFQDAGAHVILGVPGLKVHSKLCLITRREHGHRRYYSAIGTGNFNEETAKLYTDHLLLTSDQEIGDDVDRVFRYFRSPVKAPRLRHLLMAPFSLRQSMYHLIDQEIRCAKQRQDAGIAIKLNNLSDVELIRMLYRASRKGVPVRLIVRGMFSVVPGAKGCGEDLDAIGIVDRFLEHTRILHFENGGYFISSADFLPRNFDSRVEVVCPIIDPELQDELRTYLKLQWRDRVKARILDKELSNALKGEGAGRRRASSAQAAISEWLRSLVD